jgi:hypothetical protein
MNISKSLALCFLATAFALAQVPLEEQPAPVSSDSSVIPGSPPAALEAAPISSSSETIAVSLPAPSSSSAAEETKPAAPESKTIFNSLRGYAYNPYSTVGAASTIEDLIKIPSDINGQRFFYISPTYYLGYAAFDFGSGTAMLGLDNSPLGKPAALVLGYANSDFGIALNYSVAKSWFSSREQDLNMRHTSPGDNLELYLSMPIGSATLYANATWLTYSASSSVDYEGYVTTTDYSQIEATAGLTGKSGSLDYDGYLSVIRTGGSVIYSDGDKFIDEDLYLGFALNFNIGYAALQNSNTRVIVGLNNRLFTMFYDNTKNINGDNIKGENIIGFVTVPNILAEVSLFDNWLAFAGAGHALYLNAHNSYGAYSLNITHSEMSGVFTGIRYQKTHWALEAQISTNMFYNPFGGFSGDQMFAGLGGFIYF